MSSSYISQEVLSNISDQSERSRSRSIQSKVVPLLHKWFTLVINSRSRIRPDLRQSLKRSTIWCWLVPQDFEALRSFERPTTLNYIYHHGGVWIGLKRTTWQHLCYDYNYRYTNCSSAYNIVIKCSIVTMKETRYISCGIKHL